MEKWGPKILKCEKISKTATKNDYLWDCRVDSDECAIMSMNERFVSASFATSCDYVAQRLERPFGTVSVACAIMLMRIRFISAFFSTSCNYVIDDVKKQSRTLKNNRGLQHSSTTTWSVVVWTCGNVYSVCFSIFWNGGGIWVLWWQWTFDINTDMNCLCWYVQRVWCRPVLHGWTSYCVEGENIPIFNGGNGINWSSESCSHLFFSSVQPAQRSISWWYWCSVQGKRILCVQGLPIIRWVLRSVWKAKKRMYKERVVARLFNPTSPTSAQKQLAQCSMVDEEPWVVLCSESRVVPYICKYRTSQCIIGTRI